jgi:hypothetical protein
MRYFTLLVFCLSPFFLLAQIDTVRTWEVSTAFSYGSENNYGNPGFMLTNEVGYNFYRQISASAKVGFFHSMPWFSPEDAFFSYSSFVIGVNLNHTARFNKNRNFVKISAGLNYVHSYNLIAQDIDPLTSYYNRAQVETVSKLGYNLSLEGGGKLSEKIAMGLVLQIYSYQIFGDIIVIGPNIHFKL